MGNHKQIKQREIADTPIKEILKIPKILIQKKAGNMKKSK